jgi:tetratricopeptide (TPR) repeat protein
LDDYPCKYELTIAEQQTYSGDKLKVQHDITRVLNSAGRNGRGQLLRMSLAILTYQQGPRCIQKVQGDDGIERFFQSLFQDIPHHLFAAYMPVHKTYSSEIEQVFPCDLLRRDWRKLGHMFWNECIVRTKDSEVRYSGPYLFANYLDSAAQAKLHRGDIDGALELYEKIAVEQLLSGKVRGDVWDTILSVSAMNRKFDFVTRFAESIVTILPTSEQAWFFLLRVSEERGNLQEGLERLKLAIEEQPFACFRALGRAACFVGDSINVLETLEKAINIDPLNASHYWIDIGHIYADLEDHDKAIHAYETAVSLSDQPIFRIHSFLGDCYKAKGRFRDAIVQYEQKLAIEGWFDDEAIRPLIEIYIDTGEYDNAIQTLVRATVRYPNESGLKSLLGEVFMEVADYDSAIVAFQTAINEEGDKEGFLWKLIGHASEHKSDLIGAISAYKMAVEIDPDDEESREALDELEKTMRDQVVGEKRRMNL